MFHCAVRQFERVQLFIEDLLHEGYIVLSQKQAKSYFRRMIYGLTTDLGQPLENKALRRLIPLL